MVKTATAITTKTKASPLKKIVVSPNAMNAAAFIKQLRSFQSAKELEKIQRYFKTGKGTYGHGDTFIGVRMGQVFAIAAAFLEMPLKEIEKLLESPIHEARAGA